jgi:hypothetical protein
VSSKPDAQQSKVVVDMSLAAVALAGAGCVALFVMLLKSDNDVLIALLFVPTVAVNFVVAWTTLRGLVRTGMRRAPRAAPHSGIFDTKSRTRGFLIMLSAGTASFVGLEALALWLVARAEPTWLGGHAGIIPGSVIAGFPVGYGLAIAVIAMEVSRCQPDGESFVWDSGRYWLGGGTWDRMERLRDDRNDLSGMHE